MLCPMSSVYIKYLITIDFKIHAWKIIKSTIFDKTVVVVKPATNEEQCYLLFFAKYQNIRPFLGFSMIISRKPPSSST